MATIRAHTTIEQSRKLAEILPLESADMWWSRCTITDFGDGVLKVSYAVEPCNISQFRKTKDDIPCWSLAALLDILDYPQLSKDKLGSVKEGWMVSVYPNDCRYDSCWQDNPIDACVAMIEKLNKLKLL